MSKTDRRSDPAGPPPEQDPGAEAKRREIERQVYRRRTAGDREAEEKGAVSPHIDDTQQE